MKKKLCAIIVLILALFMFVPQTMFSATAATGASISVSNIEAHPGDTVDVTVNIANNPGVTSVLLSIGYDSSALTLTGVTDGGILGSAFHSNNYKNPYTLCWANDTATTNITSNGKAVTLTFKVADNAAIKKYSITVSYDLDNYEIIDKDMNPISFSLTNGSIDVKEPGCKHTNTTNVPARASTCSEQGNNAYTRCNDCGEVVSGSDAKLPLGDCSFGSWSTTKAATCTAVGQQTRICSVCKKTESKEVPAHGHKYEVTEVTEPTCTEKGYTTYTCSHCLESYKDNYKDALNHPTAKWYTVVNPTVSSDGLAEMRCEKCDKVLEQFIIPCLNPDFVTGVSLSSKSENVKVGDTFTLEATIIPDTAENQNVVWSSRNPEIATVVNGKVTAVKPGTTAIVVTTEDGGYVDFCLVKVTGLSGINGAVVNVESNFVYGLSCNLNNVEYYLETTDDNMSIVTSDDVVGTGTTISVIENGEVVDSYTAVIFGDVDGNGWYDANDAFLVRMLEVGLLTSADVSEAIYKAADCNHDGVVDGLDVQLLEKASLLLDNVNQNATQAELKLDAYYIEYCSVIDQSPSLDTSDSVTPPAESDIDNEFKFDFAAIFKFIIMLIERVITLLTSII